MGLSLTVTAPTGQYNPGKLLNLGAARWSFKPELAVSVPFGSDQKWEVDAYANAYFFTDNTACLAVEVLRQEPLPGLEGHLSYSLSNNLGHRSIRATPNAATPSSTRRTRAILNRTSRSAPS